MPSAAPIEQSFWNLFGKLRGLIDTNQFLAQIASLVVLRWADQQETDQEAIASFDGTSFSPTLAPASRWREFCNLDGPALSEALAEQVAPAIKQSREVGSGALVRRIEHTVRGLPLLGSEVLGPMVELVRTLPLVTPADREQVLDAFDAALSSFGDLSGAGTGAFSTPSTVVDLVVKLASPQPGERIYDPCFGVAAMLAACARRVRTRVKTAGLRAGLEATPTAFLGVELRPDVFTIGLARMILAGVDRPALELGNTLERPMPRDRAAEGFDCIVSDPPFGGKLLLDAARQFPVKATSSEALFLQHIMASLRPGGRAVVVLPQAAFFRGGPDEAVRKLLLEEYRVETVVSLPAGAYSPYSGVKTGVIVIRREPPGTHVRFVDAERPSITDGAEAQPEGPLFDAAALAASACGESEAYEAREVPVEELLREGATLVPARHDSPFLSFVRAIRETDATVPVRALADVAEIFTGFPHVAKNLLDRREEPSLPGYLRVTEVVDGDTKSPVRFLTPEFAKSIPPEKRLRLGDIVVTRSGSIGRVAMIANGALGCVAAMGLFVLRARPELISPHYLAALLQSAPIRAWMTGQARGLTVQHVPISELRRLEIPVPELALQDRVVRAHRTEGADASDILLRALTTAPEDPVVQWIESNSAVQRLVAMQQAPPEQAMLAAIEVIAFELQLLLSRSRHVDPLSRDLSIWATNTGAAIEPLVGIGSVPLGAGRLAVLDIALRSTEDALRALLVAEGTNPALDMAGEVSRKLTWLFELLIGGWAKSFKLVPSVDLAVLEAGTGSAMTLRVRNEGPMPVRNVVVQTSGPMFSASEYDFKLHAKAAYLDVGQEISATAAVLAPRTAGTLDFRVSWEALQLDGRRTSGEFPFAVEIRGPQETGPAVDLGTSPYIVGSPVDRPEMLYGRDSILADIKRQLPTDHRANIILLEGNRRTGKTSILKRLEIPDQIPGWIAVNTNLQGAEGSGGRTGVTANEIFRLLAHDLALALVKAGTPVWLPDVPPPDSKRHYELQLKRALAAYFDGDHPFETYEIYLKTVLAAVAPRRVLLMLDEFDKIQEGIDAGSTSPQVPENLRYLFHTYPQLGGILSGSRRLTRLRNEYWSALFGIGYAIRVGPLAQDDARALVTAPVAGRLVYASEARDRIIDLCACQPFLIQTLCNRIFKDAHARRTRTVLLEDVERAASEMTGDNEHFETLWSYARTERRRLILALLCKLDRGSEGLSLDAGTLEDELGRLEIPLPESGLGDDIAHLRELELVELEAHDGYQRYRLQSPLMAEWIRRNKDFSDLARRAISAENGGRD